MSNLNEKEILENIKASIENETPDVWEKIKDTESCRYDLQSRPEKANRMMVRWAAAAAVIAVIGFTGIRMNFINLPGNRERIADSSGAGDAAGIIHPGIPEIAAGREPATTLPAEIFRPFIKDVKADEAARAMNINIAEPSWLPDGYKQISSQLFCYNEDYSKPYMYQMQFVNAMGNDFTISVQKYMTEKEKLESQPESIPMPMPGAKAIPPDAQVPPDAPVQSAPGYNPAVMAVPPPSAVSPANNPAVDLPATTSIAGSGPSTGSASTGSAGAGAAVSVEIVRVTIEGTDVDLTIFNESQAVSAFWAYEGSAYNISTGGISKDDMTKIIESMVK